MATKKLATNKNKQKPEMTLQEFWDSLADNRQTRAHIMGAICAEARVSYQHVRLVINRKRSLSVNAATRLQEEIAKRGTLVPLTEFMIPQDARR